LALIRAFCASFASSRRPESHSARKFFRGAKLGVPAPSRARKFAASDRDGVEVFRRDKIYDSAETL
jgi:hypothetical protein